MGLPLSIFWGIVAGALILALTYVGYREYEHRRDIREATEVIQAIATAARDSVKAPVVVSPSVDPRVATEAIQAKRPRRLADNQRCVGGLVISVDGSSYTQTGERCSGRFVVP